MRKFKAFAFQEKNDVETWQQVKFHSFTPKPYEYVKKLELAKNEVVPWYEQMPPD